MRHITLFCLILILTSCSMFGQQKVRHSKTTSLVNFLYPDGVVPDDLHSPVLKLPLRVGLAYVPAAGSDSHIKPALKLDLLNAIKQQFEGRRYIQRIEIIPELYFSQNQNASQLEQIRQLYQLDVIALVSYDQIVNRKENLLVMTYLTIVGSYVFPGSHFDVSTLIDMALIDLNSRRLLFRAAGSHGSKDTTAEAYTKHQYDQHQNDDFMVAMNQLRTQLSFELQAFEQRLKAKDPNDDIQVTAKPGYEMAIDRPLLLWLLFSVLVATFIRVRNH